MTPARRVRCALGSGVASMGDEDLTAVGRVTTVARNTSSQPRVVGPGASQG